MAGRIFEKSIKNDHLKHAKGSYSIAYAPIKCYIAKDSFKWSQSIRYLKIEMLCKNELIKGLSTAKTEAQTKLSPSIAKLVRLLCLPRGGKLQKRGTLGALTGSNPSK
jgi:hypothetical protein